ncbi:MAG: CehA/McbA family metallohydrolase [bacterium]|nr:CehA/McbA family metallohydrolase [bacterium]
MHLRDQSRWTLCFSAGLCLGICLSSFGQETQLAVQIVDELGQPVSARAWVDSQGQRLFQPSPVTPTTAYEQDQSFSCDGRFVIDVPPGEFLVHVERGKEYVPVDQRLMVQAGQRLEHKLQLQRWIDMKSLGWYSADLHVHLGYDNLAVLKQLALADDVNLLPSFTYWLRGDEDAWAKSWPSEDYLKPVAADDSHWVSRNNIEIERIRSNAGPAGAVGATFLFNLKRPVRRSHFGEHFPTDASLCAEARVESADSVFDSDKPSWAETVVGVALGQIDTIQLCHNHYNRERTLPGGWGMIGPLAPGESNAAIGDGLFHRTNALYYRLLNCGFHLGVSGGSAIGVMPAPAGFARVYARIEGPFSADKMWAAMKSGRTFATTGPMLWLNADQAQVGDTLQLSSESSSPIRVTTQVKAVENLEALEIVHNGCVVSSKDLRNELADPTVDSRLETELSIEESGWLAARALYRAPDGLLRQAHTSPIYLEVDGQAVRFRYDVAYMLQWIARLESVAIAHPEWFPDEASKQAVLSDYQRARQGFLDKLADLAAPQQP